MRWREHKWQKHYMTCNGIMTNSHTSLAEWQMLLKEHFCWQWVGQTDNLVSWDKDISEICNWESSSLSATTSIFECFGLLNIWFPLTTILSAANPIFYFKFLPVISYVIFPSVLWSPLWSYWHQFPPIYFFLPFSLLAFDVNGQTSLIAVLSCDLLFSYVLLIHLMHCLFWFSMYHLFLL